MAKTSRRVDLLLTVLCEIAAPVLIAVYLKAPAIAQTTVNNGNGVAVGTNTGTINNINPAEQPRDHSHISAGSGFGCGNSKGAKYLFNYAHDNAGKGFDFDNCPDVEAIGNISEHNGYPVLGR